MKWRLLDLGARTGAENMALDETLLQAMEEQKIHNTLRFMQFYPKVFLVGFHQHVEDEIRVEYCKNNGIDINRRISGGGAILLDETQLGWELVVSTKTHNFPKKINELNNKICEGVILALKNLGINASFRPRNDIEVNGRKISGTGGTGLAESFLFHGTLLIDFDVETMVKGLKILDEKILDKNITSIKERVTWVKRELGYVPPLKEIKLEIKKAFEEVFGVEFVENGLTEYEEKIFNEKLNYFKSDDWIYKVKKPSQQEIRTSLLKTQEGGIIKVYLALQKRFNRVQQLMITGDFFTQHRNTILELESKFKNIVADKENISKICREFFKDPKYKIIGITEDEIIKAITECLNE